MKKLLSSLAFIALFSLAFISCDDNTIDNLTGNMDITVDGENKNFSVATFYTSENKLTITGGVGNGNVTIVIKGKTADTYTLGLGKNKGDLTDDILEGDLSALTSGNILTYSVS